MALPAAENTREAYNAAIANSLTPTQAAEQAAVAGGGTLAMGAIPANIPGELATRALSGAAIAGLQTEGQRRLANALLPEDRPDLQQPFDAFNLGAGVLTGGFLAGALGHGADGPNVRTADRTANEGPISNPTPRVASTNFVADADGYLREVPRQPEQTATSPAVAASIDPNAGPLSRAAAQVTSAHQAEQNILPSPVRYPDAPPGSMADAVNSIDQHAVAEPSGTERSTPNVFDAFHAPGADEGVAFQMRPSNQIDPMASDASRATPADTTSAADSPSPDIRISNAKLGTITRDSNGSETVETTVGPRKLNSTDYDVGYGGSSQKDGTVLLQRGFDYTIKDGPLKGLDTRPFLAEHEAVERNLENTGNDYTAAHKQATDAEHTMLLDKLGLKPGTPDANNAIEAYEAHNKTLLQHSAAVENPKIAPDLLDLPYEHPHTAEQRRLLDEVQAAQSDNATGAVDSSDSRNRVDAAARESAAHPENNLPEPSPAQHEANNYKQGHINLHGLDVTIQVPKGGMRRGTDRFGKDWERPASDHYGHIRGTDGGDGEPHDVYLGPHAEDPNAKVFVVDQVKPGTRVFDEKKAMIGYASGRDARRAYDANFPKDIKTFGGIKEISLNQFKETLNADSAKAQSDRFSDFKSKNHAEFHRFFDGSHVKNGDGSPRIVYHGTGDDFHVFRDDKLGGHTGHMTAPLGHFLTESRSEAERYAEKAANGVPADERVISAYASIKNPARMTKDQFLRIDSHQESRALRQWLEHQGHDGIRLDLGNGKKQWIAFHSGQIKDVNNRGTFDRTNPDIRYQRSKRNESPPSAFADALEQFRQSAPKPTEADAARMAQTERGIAKEMASETRRKTQDRVDEDAVNSGEGSRFQRAPDESENGLTKEEVNRLATGVLKTDTDRAGVHVVDSAAALPQAIQDHMQANSIPPEEVKAAHLGGKTYLVADKLKSAEDVQEAIYHDHFVHGGLRLRYGNRLGGKLDQLLRGIGGLDGLRAMAKAQGIDLSHYEATTLGNSNIPERHQHLILMEELLAHLAHTTGTLKRTIQEWVGTLRDWLRRNGFAKLAGYGVTDLAHVLKEARAAALDKPAAEGSSQPYYQRDPENAGRTRETNEPAGIPGRATEPQRATETPNVNGGAEPPPSNLPPRSPKETPDEYLRRLGRATRDDVRAATSLRAQQKTIGRHALREMFAKQARAVDTADAVFGEFRKHFDKTDPRANFAAIDDWETGRQVQDPTFREFLSKMNSGFAERIERLHELDPNALRNLITNYFPHLYKDPLRAGTVLSSLLQRHSLAGDKSFLKQREWPTLREAMQSGLEPISSNPVDLALLKYAAMDKYTGMLELKKELDDRGWLVKLGNDDSPPFGFKRVADPAFNGSAIPETLARDVTNYLDPGFSKFAAWRTLRGIQNFMVAADLGFSGFHATFTSTDNVIMHLDVAARRAAIGDSRGAAATLVKALTSVATSPFEGHKLNQQWRGLREADANTAAILDALERGGARWKMSTTEYQNAIPKMARLFRQMMGTGIGPQVKGKTPAQIAVGAARVPLTALQAAAETGSYLIHHVLVPNQKMAARVLLYKYELDRRAHELGRQRGDYAGIIDAMHPDVVRQLAAQVNDVVDFRLGQMAYDNRFWNRTAQDVAQAVVMAPGWQVGMVQTVAGAAKAMKDIVSPGRFVAPLDKAGNINDAHMGRVGSNLSYFLTLALTLGGGMAALQYLLTGKGPDGVKDYFFPKTGRKNDDDSDERLQLPNYWVDHYKLSTEPARTAENKIHPLWKMLWEVGHNRDYFGTQIRDPNAPAWDQALEVGAYMAHKFVPITIGNMQKGVQHSESTSQQVGHFFGINNAPAGIARSEFQNFVMQGGNKGWGNYTRTPEEAQHRQTARSASAAIRRGDEPDFGDLAPKEIANVRKDAKQPAPAILFKRLSDPDKLHAYDMATPAERERYGLDAAMQRLNLDRSTPFKNLPAAEQAKLRQRLQTIRGGGTSSGNVFDRFDNH